jgi:hypothetical protein
MTLVHCKFSVMRVLFYSCLGFVPAAALHSMYYVYIVGIETEFFTPGTIVLFDILIAPIGGAVAMILPLLASSVLNNGIKGASAAIKIKSVIFGFASAALVSVGAGNSYAPATPNPLRVIFSIFSLFALAISIFTKRAEVNILEREDAAFEEAQQTASADRREDAAPADRQRYAASNGEEHESLTFITQ